MDKRFGGQRGWIALGVAAIVFLCVMMCAGGALLTMLMHSSPAYPPQVQAPAGEDGAAPPASYYDGPLGRGRHGGWGPLGIIGAGIGLLFKLLFFGLILLLVFGLVKRLFWGHRHWGPHYRGKPPEGKEWTDKPHGWWGPWAWHCHGKPWERYEEEGGEQGEPDGSEPEFAGAE